MSLFSPRASQKRESSFSSGVNSTILAQTWLNKGLGMLVGLVAHFIMFTLCGRWPLTQNVPTKYMARDFTLLMLLSQTVMGKPV